jgi:hypothetical protein
MLVLGSAATPPVIFSHHPGTIRVSASSIVPPETIPSFIIAIVYLANSYSHAF